MKADFRIFIIIIFMSAILISCQKDEGLQKKEEEVTAQTEVIPEAPEIDDSSENISENSVNARFGETKDGVYISKQLGMKFNLTETWDFAQKQEMDGVFYEFSAISKEHDTLLELFTIDNKDGNDINYYIDLFKTRLQENQEMKYIIEDIDEILIAGKSFTGFSAKPEGEASFVQKEIFTMSGDTLIGINILYGAENSDKVDKVLSDLIVQE